MSKASFTILIVAILFGSSVIMITTAQDDARTELLNAFKAVQSAERAGYDIADLVSELNIAAGLLDLGGENNVSKALTMIHQVSASTPVVPSTWIQAQNDRIVIRIAIVVVLGVAALIVWFFGSTIYWWVWRRTMRRWRVERI